MEKSKAVNGLAEALDLMRMVEDVMSPSNERMTSSLPGLRISIREARERMMAAYEVFARELVQGARTASVQQQPQMQSRGEISSSSLEQGYRAMIQKQATEGAVVDESMTETPINRRRDLRAALEKSGQAS